VARHLSRRRFPRIIFANNQTDGESDFVTYRNLTLLLVGTQIRCGLGYGFRPVMGGRQRKHLLDLHAVELALDRAISNAVQKAYGDVSLLRPSHDPRQPLGGVPM
jgi:hypothetical protein